jgi:H+-transporting ATPase
MDSFGMFYLGDRVFHLDRALIQTLMYLKLSVAGHFKIFLTRTRGPFWSIRPARILLVMVFGTQIVATLVAVYGLFMPPIGWGWAAMVWGYSLLWFLVNDRVKLLAYRIFDPVKKAEAKTEPKEESQPVAKAEPKPEVRAEAKSDTKDEPQPETKAEPEAKDEPKSEPKTPTDLTPEMIKRVHKLYEELGRQDLQAVEDLEKAERENRKDDK